MQASKPTGTVFNNVSLNRIRVLHSDLDKMMQTTQTEAGLGGEATDP